MSARAPAVHSVHIYNEQSALISRLCGIVSSSLRVGDAVLIVATAETRNQLITELRKSDVDVRLHARERRFSMVDACEALSSFMVKGLPDSGLFTLAIGQLLADSRKRARSESHGLTVFGEMVAVLWDQGNKQAALQLEGLWNAALNHRTFHLHCAYPRSLFTDDSDVAAVCSAHSHILQDRALPARPEVSKYAA
ncbi:MAG: MEDS domain-containing protein [Terriglobales bacterium]